MSELASQPAGLCIRSAQVRVLNETSLTIKLSRYLVAVFPDRFASMEPPRLTEEVNALLARAHAYGIRTDRATSLFAALAVGLEPALDTAPEHAWIRERLAERDEPDYLRLDSIYAELSRRAEQSR